MVTEQQGDAMTRDQLNSIKEETRKQRELIADEAIACFISLLPGKIPKDWSEKHEKAIALAIDACERRNEAFRRLRYARRGESVPMPDGEPDMDINEVKAMYV